MPRSDGSIANAPQLEPQVKGVGLGTMGWRALDSDGSQCRWKKEKSTFRSTHAWRWDDGFKSMAGECTLCFCRSYINANIQNLRSSKMGVGR